MGAQMCCGEMLERIEHMSRFGTLPSFKEPPVIEVVCGVAFQSLENFQVCHFGRYWDHLGADWTETVDQPALPQVIEETGKSEVQFDAVSPRVWYIHSAGHHLIQVQRDRFLLNWRKTSPTHAYPSYLEVKKAFDERFSDFSRFTEAELNSAPQCRQYELTYINHLVAGGGVYSDLAHIGEAISLMREPKHDGFLPGPSALNLRMSFEFPSNMGRLHVRVHSGRRIEDNTDVLILELTARGYSAKQEEWFRQAHEWIVRGFEDLTTVAAHETWGKK